MTKRSSGKRAKKLPLEVRLEKVRRAAPPHPVDTLYRWLRKCYRLRCYLDKEGRRELRRLYKDMGRTMPRSGDTSMRIIIELTARKHMKMKVKLRYAARLAEARLANVSAKGLRDWIKNHGGING